MKLNKYQNYSKYKNGIAIPSLIGTVLFIILYSYSRITSPGVEVFLSDSLYSLAASGTDRLFSLPFSFLFEYLQVLFFKIKN